MEKTTRNVRRKKSRYMEREIKEVMRIICRKMDGVGSRRGRSEGRKKEICKRRKKEEITKNRKSKEGLVVCHGLVFF
jgi:hypothetical protein